MNEYAAELEKDREGEIKKKLSSPENCDNLDKPALGAARGRLKKCDCRLLKFVNKKCLRSKKSCEKNYEKIVIQKFSKVVRKIVIKKKIGAKHGCHEG